MTYQYINFLIQCLEEDVPKEILLLMLKRRLAEEDEEIYNMKCKVQDEDLKPEELPI